MRQCEIVQDLLPLYVDGVCSEASSELVREHLETCAVCREMYQNMRSHMSEDAMQKERDDIIVRHTNKENQKFMACIFAAIAVIYIPALFIIPLFDVSKAGFIATPYAFDLLVFFLYSVPFWLAFIEFGQLVCRAFEKKKMGFGEKVFHIVGGVLAAGILLTIFNLAEFLYLSLLLAVVLLINGVIRAVVCKKKPNVSGILKQKVFWICVLCLIAVMAVIISVAVIFLSVQNVREEVLEVQYGVGVRECGSEMEGVYWDVGMEEQHAWNILGRNPTITVRWVNATDENVNYPVGGYVYKQTEDGWGLCMTDRGAFVEGFDTVRAESTQTQIYSLSGYDISTSGIYRFVTFLDGNAIWVEFDLAIEKGP